jgi:hypothetical protein
MNDILYSLEGHNSKYGTCTHTCKDGIWQELKNCCCGADGDNDWYFCGGPTGFPYCDKSLDGLVIYTNCYPINKTNG